jgi:diacylglycerol O-acyltransferase / wax synthase
MVTRIIAKKASKGARGAAKVVQKNVERAVAGTLGLSGERMSKVDTAWTARKT